ncbi:hypothetical protein EVAR_63452_1 [Eumeta japonica]|uniref:Ig-like domain-containing protein n=1 Tax=Eumeta variegata TaxID=151549 RepID=A0A4C1ZZK0_EUMVA|nr:hypothetical protein EVAR_63452_1 [Eumeta japonica]
MTQFLVPNHVIAGNDARLECNYDLEDEVLYAVKWYKDGNEFFHYQPGNDPPKQSFPEFGVDVDFKSSESPLALSTLVISI